MKKRTSTVIAILMILIGLSLLLYPTVSDYLKNLAYRRTISNYNASVDSMDDERYEEMLAAAWAYNEQLAQKGGYMFTLSEEEQEEYNSLLNIDDTGVMGYVSVPKVDIALPIYHGTSEGVLQNGVGHLEGSSLPVGGPGTHAVLSAHTGLPSAKLFTNIDQLVEGDTFTVRVLKETLTYQVDQILVVLPYQLDALRIETGEDYCTLVTCTPYGVNSHRLLVRGHRIPTPTEEKTPSNTTEKSLNNGRLLRMVVTLVFLLIAILLLSAFVRVLLKQERAKMLWKRAKRQMLIAVLLPVAFLKVLRKRVKRWLLMAVLLPVVFWKVLCKRKRARRMEKQAKQQKKEEKSNQDFPEP